METTTNIKLTKRMQNKIDKHTLFFANFSLPKKLFCHELRSFDAKNYYTLLKSDKKELNLANYFKPETTNT